MAVLTLNIDGCIQCGRCSGGCPVSMKSGLNIRMLVYSSQDHRLKPAEITELGVWECTACTTCNERCPKEVNPAELVIQLRSRLVEGGRMASTVQAALESTYLQGNPWSRARENRMQWADGLDVRTLAEGDRAEVLLFVCCTDAYDERCQQTVRALVRLLRAADVDFGVIGTEESCCASEQRRLGEEGLFDELAEANTRLLNARKADWIVTISPHCFNAFRHDYPGIDTPVLHYTQFLDRLLTEGRLKLKQVDGDILTYHDPCFLGKQNKVFDEPRRLLAAVAGTRFVEFDRCRESSLCCEGGGGRMWLESEGTGRLSEVRVRDAIAMGARTLVTACPFCTLTLEDAVKTTDSEDKVRIRDLAEVLADAL